MKLKFYLRGLGIGILVTAVIMGIVSSRSRQMTDEEIKARARELGMVESTTLSAMASGEPQGNQAPSQAPEDTPAASVSPSASPEESPSVSPSASPKESPSVSPSAPPVESTPAASPSPDGEQEVPAGEFITITIRSGQSSVAVSKMLEEAGLVESASAYDKYLCSNGYDKRLKTGAHEIPVGATEEEIAVIITSKGN